MLLADRLPIFFVFLISYLVAILLDILRSSPPIALVIDDTSNGTIRHLSILYWTWLAHRWKSFIIANLPQEYLSRKWDIHYLTLCPLTSTVLDYKTDKTTHKYTDHGGHCEHILLHKVLKFIVSILLGSRHPNSFLCYVELGCIFRLG